MSMTIIADVAMAYYRLIALDNELSIVRRTMATRKQSLEQAKIRFDGGLTSETVYQQAKVEYSTAASPRPEPRTPVAVARNALTLLLGEYPREISERGDRHSMSLSPKNFLPECHPHCFSAVLTCAPQSKD